MQVEQKFKNTVSKHNLLNKGDRVIVAVSGGPDSVCLLFLLKSLKEKLNLYLHIASLNHLIRKEQAAKDIEFVKKLARKLGLPLTIAEADVPKFAESKKLSLEEAARIARFGFLKKVAAKNKADKIAFGHNSDDQVETFLMRLIRGAGLSGLCGMALKRKEDSLELIRPLLEISRQEIESFLGQRKIKFRIDSTNQEARYFRNKIRLKLLPLLRNEYNPKIAEIILRTVHNMREIHEFIDEQVILKTQRNMHKGDFCVSLDLKNLKDSPWIIKTHVLRKAILALKGNLRQFSYENWTALENLAFVLQSGKRLFLPGGISAKKTYDTLILERKTEKKEMPAVKQTKINCPGKTLIKDLNMEISARIFKRRPFLQEKTKWIEFMDADKIACPVFVRTRKEKDIFCPLGMKGTKLLKEFFIDEKIPSDQREKIPVIEDNEKIVWVAGSRISDKVKISIKTKNFLRLEIKKINPKKING